jgi:hypothetical protein
MKVFVKIINPGKVNVHSAYFALLNALKWHQFEKNYPFRNKKITQFINIEA